MNPRWTLARTTMFRPTSTQVSWSRGSTRPGIVTGSSLAGTLIQPPLASLPSCRRWPLAELRFIPASSADLTFIFENVRKENLAELEVFDDLGLDAAIGQSIERSSEAFVAVIDGEPVCAFGVVDSGRPGTGRPWMVGTSNIDRHGIAFLRASKQVIADIMVRWPHLENSFISPVIVKYLLPFCRLSFNLAILSFAV